jgi:ribose 5-phosphate isomerase A
MDVEGLKREAGEEAVARFVTSGSVIGLGTGSTAVWAIRAVGARLAEGSLVDVRAVATSDRTALEMRAAGVPETTLTEHPRLAVAIDGADEISPQGDLVKGGGGALLREKIVASAADEFVVVADATKRVERLGTRSPLPVEVIPMAVQVVLPHLETLGCEATLRLRDETPFVTDEGHRIVDCRFADGIADPAALGAALHAIPGVVEHGLFLGMADALIVAG